MTDTRDAGIARRSFLRTGLAVGGATVTSALAAPAVLAQAPKVVKMQTSWPAADIWMDFARQYTARVEEMSGGRLKFDLLPAGAVVGFDELCDPVFPGETAAFLELLGERRLKLQRVPYVPGPAFVVID